MKKIVYTILAFSLLLGAVASLAGAQMMSSIPNSTVNWNEVVEHTRQGETKGEELWKKIQAKEVGCVDLTDEEFNALGEYFMGAMTGESHAAMNAMMIQAHDSEGEEAIHIVMGKRLSGYNASATFPTGAGGWMPMMNMIMPYGRYGSSMGITGNWSSPHTNTFTNSMMNFGFGFGLLGTLFTLLWWALIIAGIIALIEWISTRGGEKSSLDILKERYARGEIDKKEFEERRRDLA